MRKGGNCSRCDPAGRMLLHLEREIPRREQKQIFWCLKVHSSIS